jgi:hypothetical protein
MTEEFRFTRHNRPSGTGCPWSHCSVVAPEQRARPGNRRCPDECPTSDVEVNPYADDQRYDPTLPDPADEDDTEAWRRYHANHPEVLASYRKQRGDWPNCPCAKCDPDERLPRPNILATEED